MKNRESKSKKPTFPDLEPVLEQYAAQEGSLITILQKTQEIYGYLSEDAMLLIAARTGVAPAKVYGVATFYTQFRLKPVGKYIIMLCRGTACHVNGAAGIEEAISEHLSINDGETTADGLFTLDVVACLGCCSLAPVMMIKGPEGDETFGSLTKVSAVKILDEIASRAAEKGAVK
jgi:NADH-quinone oxidoreductase subunit E